MTSVCWCYNRNEIWSNLGITVASVRWTVHDVCNVLGECGTTSESKLRSREEGKRQTVCSVRDRECSVEFDRWCRMANAHLSDRILLLSSSLPLHSSAVGYTQHDDDESRLRVETEGHKGRDHRAKLKARGQRGAEGTGIDDDTGMTRSHMYTRLWCFCYAICDDAVRRIMSLNWRRETRSSEHGMLSSYHVAARCLGN